MVRRFFPAGVWSPVATVLAVACLAAALVALLLLPEQWWLAAAPALILAWLIRRSEGRLLRRSPADVLLGLLILLALMSWALSPAPALARQPWGYLLAGALLYWLVLVWAAGPTRLRFLLMVVLLATASLAALSPLMVDASKVQLSWMPAPLAALGDKIPETVNPNVISGALAAWLPVSLSLAWRPVGETPRARGRLQALALATSLIVIFILLIFRTRGVWVAIPVAAGMAALFRRPRWWVAIPAIFVGVWVLATMGGLARLESLVFQGDPFGGLSGRVEIWTSALQALRDFPLTGIGLGGWSAVIPLFYPYRSLALLAPGVEIPHAHNLLLQVGLDLGLMGMAAYAALWGLSAWMALQAHRAFRGRRSPAWATLALAVTAGLLVIAFHGLIDAVTWGTKPAIFTWLLYALAAGLYLEIDMVASS